MFSQVREMTRKVYNLKNNNHLLLHTNYLSRNLSIILSKIYVNTQVLSSEKNAKQIS
jgi:hypothetical protein